MAKMLQRKNINFFVKTKFCDATPSDLCFTFQIGCISHYMVTKRNRPMSKVKEKVQKNTGLQYMTYTSQEMYMPGDMLGLHSI